MTSVGRLDSQATAVANAANGARAGEEGSTDCVRVLRYADGGTARRTIVSTRLGTVAFDGVDPVVLLCRACTRRPFDRP